MSRADEVVITGAGALGAFGLGRASLWRCLCEGTAHFSNAVPAAEGLPALPPLLASRVSGFEPAELLGRKGLRSLNRESQLFVAASVLALRDAGVDAARTPAEETGVCVGTQYAGLDDFPRFHLDGKRHGPRGVNPTQGPNTGFNAPSSHAAIRVGLRGANLTVSLRRASSVAALALAADFVRQGRVRRMVVGGIEAITWFTGRALVDAGAMPEGLPRPFDAHRSRPAPGEGAAALVIESAATAAARGARVLAAVGGSGAGFDPIARGGSPATATARAIRAALASDGAARVDAVFSSARGDRAGDASEAAGLAGGLGEDLASTPVAAVAGALGDWRGACGALQAVAAAQSIVERTMPPTAGFSTADSTLPSLRVLRAPWQTPLARVLVVAVDEVGHAAAIVLRQAAP